MRARLQGPGSDVLGKRAWLRGLGYNGLVTRAWVHGPTYFPQNVGTVLVNVWSKISKHGYSNVTSTTNSPISGSTRAWIRGPGCKGLGTKVWV